MNEAHPAAGNDARSEPPIRAAQYIRMSTEHQQYSTENQAEMIQEYARRRGFEIVRTYADEGKSGLRIEGRDALKQLIDDVQRGKTDYRAILVYDISRWGRFQDSDESAYYEYVCKRTGIDVVYCAEQFENDGSPVSTIIKGVKRAMAGEYSRELSAKVFRGQCKLIQLGYRQGGPAGFGLQRKLVDQTGKAKGLLKPGEHKSIQTDRVVLVPGPDDEIRAVRWVYEIFIKEGLTEAYESKNLRGKALLKARRLVESRRSCGKRLRGACRKRNAKNVSHDNLLRTYHQETRRQRYIISKSKVCEARLLFVSSGLRSLFKDESFVTLLREEGLDTLPKFLTEHIYGGNR